MFGLTIITALIGLLAIGSIWSGYVLTILWTWFIVPTFGVPALTLAPAIGLSIVVSYLTHQYAPKTTEKHESEWHSTLHLSFHILLKPTLALLMGWMVKQWM
jgi:hypothetical protein